MTYSKLCLSQLEITETFKNNDNVNVLENATNADVSNNFSLSTELSLSLSRNASFPIGGKCHILSEYLHGTVPITIQNSSNINSIEYTFYNQLFSLQYIKKEQKFYIKTLIIYSKLATLFFYYKKKIDTKLMLYNIKKVYEIKNRIYFLDNQLFFLEKTHDITEGVDLSINLTFQTVLTRNICILQNNIKNKRPFLSIQKQDICIKKIFNSLFKSY